MQLLDALFSGAKALIKEISTIGRTLIREVLKEVDQSAIGRVTTRLVDTLVDYIGQAQNLAEEERELAKKSQRDGHRSEADTDRLQEIEAERAPLRANLEQANAELAAREFKSRADEALVVRLDDDELSSNVGIVAAKLCPACGGSMRIRQGGIDTSAEKRKFYWQCTEPNRSPCPTIKLDPEGEKACVIRPADLDLDTPKAERRAIWNRPDIVAETHSRVRQHLGDEDKQLICPHHLLPMKLLPKRHQGGGVLDSYQYVCLGVTANGRACDHTVDLQTMPQVAAMLRRTEGDGIIRT